MDGSISHRTQENKVHFPYETGVWYGNSNFEDKLSEPDSDVQMFIYYDIIYYPDLTAVTDLRPSQLHQLITAAQAVFFSKCSHQCHESIRWFYGSSVSHFEGDILWPISLIKIVPRCPKDIKVMLWLNSPKDGTSPCPRPFYWNHIGVGLCKFENTTVRHLRAQLAKPHGF